jgi:predicted RNA-binding protein with RPS1 domain
VKIYRRKQIFAAGVACFSPQIFVPETAAAAATVTCIPPSKTKFPSSLSFHCSFRSFNRKSSSFSTLRAAATSPLSSVDAVEAVQEVEEQEQTPPQEVEDQKQTPPQEVEEQTPPPVDESSSESPPSPPSISPVSADWEMARTYLSKGLIYRVKVGDFNNGGLRLRFQSIVGFLPFSQLSPSHACKDPKKKIKDIARDMFGSTISVKVIKVDEENNRLIYSEKEAVWSKYSPGMSVGDVYEARVGRVEDYGAFLHLRFPDGRYHITGLVHLSEVSWDLVQDVRDVLTEGDVVKAVIISIDRQKSRIALSLKQLEDDPLLETLDKVIPQNGTLVSGSPGTEIINIDPLPGLEMIIAELIQEDGINDINITRQGFEKRVVSQDLQLWLSNAPPIGNQFTLLARAGRQVQEIQLTTTLNPDGIKKALQRVLERVP